MFHPTPNQIISAATVGVNLFKKVAYDNIYLHNKNGRPIYVAIKFCKDDKWYARYWYKVQSGEKQLLISERIDSPYIYLYGFEPEEGVLWGGCDHEMNIDGVTRSFTQYHTGSYRGDFTVSFTRKN